MCSKYYLEIYFLISKHTVVVWLLFLWMISSLIALWSKNILHKISVLWNLLELISWLNIKSFCKYSTFTWKKIWILPFLVLVFYICPLGQVSYRVAPIFYIFIDFLNLLVLLVTERSILKSPKMIVNFLVFPFHSVNFYFIYFEAMLLVMYAF